VRTISELEIFLRLAAKGRLGAGERAAIAVALNRGCALAIDDSRAIRRALQEAALGENALSILRTQDIMVELIRGTVVSIEAPRYEDNETTTDQLKARLAKTVAYLKTLDRKQIDASADREITFPLGPTNKGHMKGDDYLNHFVLPNFYFHVTAAYAILRHCGVDIGKRDFLGAIPMKLT